MKKTSVFILPALFSSTLLVSCMLPIPVLTNDEYVESHVSVTKEPLSPTTTEPTLKPTLLEDKTEVKKELSTALIEEYIFQYTNEERRRHGLPALLSEVKVSEVARMHSQNMLDYNFFDHEDHNGMSSGGRMKKYYPELFGGIGENIYTISGLNDRNEADIAKRLVDGWMDSPGHRANILREKYNLLGVGVTFKNGKLYATQNFVEGYAILISSIPDDIKLGETLKLNFKFVGNFDKSRLSAFIDFPDKNFQFFLPDGKYYTGTGKYFPEWNGKNFTIRIVCNAGVGDYKIMMAKDNSFYDSTFYFKVVSS